MIRHSTRQSRQSADCADHSVQRVWFSPWYQDADTIRQSDLDASWRRRDGVTVPRSTWIIDWECRHARSCHGPS
ncbi:MAG: hypothetical protein ACK5BP_18450, partial [Planctomyces sp.]